MKIKNGKKKSMQMGIINGVTQVSPVLYSFIASVLASGLSNKFRQQYLVQFISPMVL